MKLLFYSLACLFAFTVTSCSSGGDNQNQTAAETTVDDATEKTISEIGASYDLDGKTVTLEGYLTPNSVSIVNSNGKLSASLRNDAGKTLTSISIPFGEKPNNIHFPKKYTLKDVVIYDNSGAKLTTSDKLKLEVKVTYKAKGPIAKPEFNKRTPEAVKKARMDDYNRKIAEGDGNDYSRTLSIVSIEKL